MMLLVVRLRVVSFLAKMRIDKWNRSFETTFTSLNVSVIIPLLMIPYHHIWRFCFWAALVLLWIVVVVYSYYSRISLFLLLAILSPVMRCRYLLLQLVVKGATLHEALIRALRVLIISFRHGGAPGKHIIVLILRLMHNSERLFLTQHGLPELVPCRLVLLLLLQPSLTIFKILRICLLFLKQNVDKILKHSTTAFFSSSLAYQ